MDGWSEDRVALTADLLVAAAKLWSLSAVQMAEVLDSVAAQFVADGEWPLWLRADPPLMPVLWAAFEDAAGVISPPTLEQFGALRLNVWLRIRAHRKFGVEP